MTIDQAKSMLPLIEAYIAGKQIEQWWESQQCWVATNDPSFNPQSPQFRIKPVPREWTLYRASSNGPYVYKTDDADPAFPVNERIRVREILD